MVWDNVYLVYGYMVTLEELEPYMLKSGIDPKDVDEAWFLFLHDDGDFDADVPRWAQPMARFDDPPKGKLTKYIIHHDIIDHEKVTRADEAIVIGIELASSKSRSLNTLSIDPKDLPDKTTIEDVDETALSKPWKLYLVKDDCSCCS